MGDKSARKKQYIIEKAREVFTAKGYSAVTMKDIVEACEISRGGLYLYFDSTREIFLEVLKNSEETGNDIFSGKVNEKSSATEILVLFLLEKKKEILSRKKSLNRATCEFYFEEKPERKDDILRKEFDEEVKVLTRIIEMGVGNGEFVCNNESEAALNIMYTLEGLKSSAGTFGINSETLDRQCLYIFRTLGVENDG